MFVKRERMHWPADKATQVIRRDFTYVYNEQTVACSVWAVGDNDPVETIIFLGTVQIGKLPVWIAENCPPGTVVVQGAPHWFARDDGSDIPAFMYRFTEEAFTSILATFECAEKLHVIAESQAAPCVTGILAVHDIYINKVSTIALVQPLGLNATVFGGTAEQRASVFKQRIAKNLKHQLPILLHDSRLRYNHRQMLRVVGYDNPKSNAQYASGLACDMSGDLQKLQAVVPITIICGSNDELFPAQEIKETVHQNKLSIPVITVSGVPHSPLASKGGLRLLNKALRSGS